MLRLSGASTVWRDWGSSGGRTTESGFWALKRQQENIKCVCLRSSKTVLAIVLPSALFRALINSLRVGETLKTYREGTAAASALLINRFNGADEEKRRSGRVIKPLRLWARSHSSEFTYQSVAARPIISQPIIMVCSVAMSNRDERCHPGPLMMAEMLPLCPPLL